MDTRTVIYESSRLRIVEVKPHKTQNYPGSPAKFVCERRGLDAMNEPTWYEDFYYYDNMINKQDDYPRRFLCALIQEMANAPK